MNIHRKAFTILALCALTSFSGCGDDGAPSQADATVAPTYLVSGSVTGLSGEVSLVLNGTELSTVSTDGDFAFTTALPEGSSFLVTVLGQPVDQLCAVANGSGSIATADVTNVAVTCASGPSAALSDLQFSSAELLTPAFTPDLVGYQLDLPLLTSEVTLTPTALDVTATIFVNGINVDSGAPSPPILLDLGLTSVIVQVIATNGDSRIYFADLTRGGKVFQQIAYGKSSNTDAGDEFAFSLDLSGDTLAVGADVEGSSATGVNGDQTNNGAAVSGAVYVFRRNGATWAQEAYIKASNTGVGDRFGRALALSGDTLAVTARFEDSNAVGIDGDETNNSGPTSGAVYVFQRTGTTWTQEAYIKASNTNDFDLFGESVALFGDTLAVGAIDEDSNATGVDGDQTNNTLFSSGAVYVFRRTGATWAQEAYVKASNAGTNDHFGSALALSEDTLAVAAIDEDSGAFVVGGDQSNNAAGGSGAVYVFQRSGTTWAQESYVKASNTGANDRFGTSISLSGGTLAVGAAGEGSISVGVDGNQTNNSATASGAVYVFRRGSATWAQEAYIKASNTTSQDRFGTALDLRGDTLAVGASGEDSGASGVGGDQTDNGTASGGAAYLFGRKDTVWTQLGYLKASNTGLGDNFGKSIAIDGDTVVVGTQFEASNATGIDGDETNNDASGSGAFYLFE